MKSALRKLLNATPAPVPYAAPGRFGMQLWGAESAIETYLRTFGTQGTVFAIVTTLSRAVSTPGWHLYRMQPQDGRRRYTTADQGSDQRVEVISHAAASLWKHPNDFQTMFEFVEATQQYIDLAGESFWVVDRRGSSFPVSIWNIRPDRMTVVPSPDTYIQGYIYNGPSGEKIPLGVDDVVHIKTPNPLDPYRGIGPIQSVLTNIDGIRYAAEYNRNFFLNNGIPGGVIQVDQRLSDSEWDELTDRWRESHQGVSRAHRVAVLENGAQWVNASVTNKDMDFVNLIETNRDLIREAFAIHKSMIGNADDVNRANAQTALEAFGEWHIIPRLNRIRNALNEKLLPMFGSMGQGVEFDYENPLPDDREADNSELQAKSTAAQILINSGFDPHDVLEVVGLPDMDVAEKATQAPALPPGWVAAPPAAPPASGGSAVPGPDAATEAATAQPDPAVTNRVLNKNAAAKAFQQEADDFPAEAMAWMHHAEWVGPVDVPVSHIAPDMSRMEPTDPDRVGDFAERLQQGKKLKPVILVKCPGQDKLMLVDGHHRYLAAVQEGKPVRAFVATVAEDHGGWETMHSAQFLRVSNFADLTQVLLKEFRSPIKVGVNGHH